MRSKAINLKYCVMYLLLLRCSNVDYATLSNEEFFVIGHLEERFPISFPSHVPSASHPRINVGWLHMRLRNDWRRDSTTLLLRCLLGEGQHDMKAGGKYKTSY